MKKKNYTFNLNIVQKLLYYSLVIPMFDADSCPTDNRCLSFLLRSSILPDLTVNAILTCSKPLSLLSDPFFPFNGYHLNSITKIKIKCFKND